MEAWQPSEAKHVGSVEPWREQKNERKLPLDIALSFFIEKTGNGIIIKKNDKQVRFPNVLANPSRLNLHHSVRKLPVTTTTD